jgi:hypothetical protein
MAEIKYLVIDENGKIFYTTGITSGVNGTSGSSGTDGTSGSSGTDGTSGSSGIDGTSGSSGTDGTSGSSGTDGTSGTSGEDYTNWSIQVDDSDAVPIYKSGSTESFNLLKFSGGTKVSLDETIDGDTYTVTINADAADKLEFVPNSGLQYYSGSTSGETIYNTKLTSDLEVPTSVGGILAGTTVADLSGKSLVGIVDDLLFPTVPPTYTIPTLSLSGPANYYEVGTTQVANLSLAAYDRDASDFTSLTITKNNNGAGWNDIATGSPSGVQQGDIAPQFGYADPNNPNYKFTLSYTDSGVEIPAPASTSYSYVLYDGESIYGAGVTKKDNKGELDVRSFAVRSVNAPQLGSSLGSSQRYFRGWFPYYYGNSDIIEITAAQVVTIIESGAGFNKVIASGGGNLTMNFNSSSEWMWFAIFDPFPNKNAWVDGNNPLNNGLIGNSGTDLFKAGTSLTITSSDGYWSNIPFKIYVASKSSSLGIGVISE